MLDLLGLYLILSTTFTIGKAALQFCSPIAFVGIRMIASGVLLLFFCRVTGRSMTVNVKRDLFIFSQTALFHIYLAYVLEFWSLSRLDSSLVALLYNLTPFVTALFSRLVYEERFSNLKFLGLLFGIMGLVPSLFSHGDMFSGIPFTRTHNFALIVLIIAVISSCYGWMLVKKLVVQGHYSPYVVNGWSMLFGGGAALATASLFEKYPFIHMADIRESTFYSTLLTHFSHYHAASIYVITCLMGTIFISNILFYNLYGHLLRKYSPTLLSFAGFITPLYTALFGYLFLSEPISGTFLSSMLCMSIGLFIFYKDEVFTKKEALN